MTFAKAWIGYSNLWNKFRAGIVASGSYSGTYPQSAGSWPLFEKWTAPSMAEHWVLLDCGVPTPSNYFGLAGHNLGVVAGSFVYEGGDDPAGPWTEIIDYSGVTPPLYDGEFNYDGSITYSEQYSATVISNKVLGWAYPQVTFRYYRMRVWGSAGTPSLGLIFSGMKMEFPIGFYAGFQPADWNDEAEVVNTRSDKGLFLGRSIARYGLRDFSISLSPVEHAWVDSVWMPFKRHAQRYPFLYAWGDVPDSNRAYAWVKSFAPAKVKNVKHAEVGMNCEGTSE